MMKGSQLHGEDEEIDGWKKGHWCEAEHGCCSWKWRRDSCDGMRWKIALRKTPLPDRDRESGKEGFKENITDYHGGRNWLDKTRVSLLFNHDCWRRLCSRKRGWLEDWSHYDFLAGLNKRNRGITSFQSKEKNWDSKSIFGRAHSRISWTCLYPASTPQNLDSYVSLCSLSIFA